MQGLAGNLSDLTMVSLRYGSCFVLGLWSQICIRWRSCWFPVSVTLSCCDGAGCLGPEGSLHTYKMDTENFAKPNLSVVVAKCCFRVCGVRQSFCVFSLYRNPDVDYGIFDRLLTSVAAVQAENEQAEQAVCGNMNRNHGEWLGSTTTNRHSIAAFDFATVLC